MACPFQKIVLSKFSITKKQKTKKNREKIYHFVLISKKGSTKRHAFTKCTVHVEVVHFCDSVVVFIPPR